MSTRFAALVTGHNTTRLHAFLESSELFRTHSFTDIGIVGADTFSVSQRLMESFGIGSRQCPVRFSRCSLSLLTCVEQLLLALASFRIPFSLVGLSNFGMILLEYGRRSRRVLSLSLKRYAQIQVMSKLEARCQVDGDGRGRAETRRRPAIIMVRDTRGCCHVAFRDLVSSELPQYGSHIVKAWAHNPYIVYIANTSR